MKMSLRRILAALCLSLALAGCDTIRDIITGFDEDERLPGERIPVMLLESKVRADDSLADLSVKLPPPQANVEWPQVGGLRLRWNQQVRALRAG